MNTGKLKAPVISCRSTRGLYRWHSISCPWLVAVAPIFSREFVNACFFFFLFSVLVMKMMNLYINSKFVDLASLFSQFSFSFRSLPEAPGSVLQSQLFQKTWFKALNWPRDRQSWIAGPVERADLGSCGFGLARCVWINAVLLSSRIQISMD